MVEILAGYDATGGALSFQVLDSRAALVQPIEKANCAD